MRHKNWYNIKYTTPERLAGCKGAVDYQKFFLTGKLWIRLKRWLHAPRRYIRMPKKPNCSLGAIMAFMRMWMMRARKQMGSRWILTMKRDDSNNKSVPKARLVKGFTESLDRINKESPVVSREVIKVFCPLRRLTDGHQRVSTSKPPFYRVNHSKGRYLFDLLLEMSRENSGSF